MASWSFSRVVASDACIDISYSLPSDSHISHSKSDISTRCLAWLCAKNRQKANNFRARRISSMKCFTVFENQKIKLVFG
ncbi:MAG TPA: hypothetical protein DDY57_05925 [Franconibacter pulveris]|nr:hypothetical protein [Franconibacter pulveris]